MDILNACKDFVLKRKENVISVILIAFLFLTVGMVNNTNVNLETNDLSKVVTKVVQIKTDLPQIRRYKQAKIRMKKRGAEFFLRSKIGKINPKSNQYKIAKSIIRESKRYGYNPIEIASVIKFESTFNTEAKSYVGARGLMQLMPKTAKYISDKKQIAWRGFSALEDPSYNLRLGIAYYDYLNKKFNGNRFLSLMAYNWGPGNVIRTVKSFDRKLVKSVEDYAFNIIGLDRRWRREFRKSYS